MQTGGPSGHGVRNGIARSLTVWKLVDGGRWGEEVLRERQEPSARRDEAVDRRGDVQYQNEVVDKTTMEVQRAANSLSYGGCC